MAGEQSGALGLNAALAGEPLNGHAGFDGFSLRHRVVNTWSILVNSAAEGIQMQRVARWQGLC